MPRSRIKGLENYDQRVAERLLEIEQTPTGRALVAWVRRRQPKIKLGKPVTGGGFTYPWPLSRIVISPDAGDDWLRGALAHELVHLMRFGGPGTIFGSLEQERLACWVAAKIWTEFPPGDPTPPRERPNYVQEAGWVLDRTAAEVREQMRKTWGGFYKNIPELQPGRWPWQQLRAGWPQIVYAIRLLMGRA